MSFGNSKQRICYSLIFSPLLIAIILPFVPLQGKSNLKPRAVPGAKRVQSLTVEPEKLIFLLQYIGRDYGGAVNNHTVINAYEYREQQEFSETVIDWYSRLRPETSGRPSFLNLQKLRRRIEQKCDWQEVQTLTRTLIQDLSKELGVIPYPTKTPDLAEGKRLYDLTCAVCHGSSGDGEGPVAKELNPRPNNFQDPEYMNEATPYQFFNAMTYGVQGTAMPSHDIALTDQECWNVAFYLMTLRKDFSPSWPDKDYKVSEIDLATSTNRELMLEIKSQYASRSEADSADAQWRGMVDYLRQHPPEVSPKEQLLFAQQQLRKSFAAYQNGRSEQAIKLSLDAYLVGIEPLEPHISQKDAALVTTIEQEFGSYRRAIKLGAPFAQVNQPYRNLQRSLVEVAAAVGPSKADQGFAFIQSLTIILREGAEASLLIALMLAFLASSGYRRLRKHVVVGSLFGILLGLVIWVFTQFFLSISPFQQEAMEGVTSLLATAVLFSVSFWIIHKADLRKWKTFIRAKAEQAAGAGSGLALAFVAFLVVFREAFETVLFYQVLWLRSSSVQSSVIFGFILGMLALTIFVFLIFKIGLKLPIKPFFTVSGILLGLLAVVFAGYGVRELQNIGLLRETVLPWNFSWDLLAIHATVEGLALQLGILLSFLLGWFTVFAQKFRLTENLELNPVTVE